MLLYYNAVLHYNTTFMRNIARAEAEQFGTAASLQTQKAAGGDEEIWGSHRFSLPARLSQRSSHGDGDYVTT